MQIIIVDYFAVKRGNVHVPSLFTPARGTLYYYTRGWNLKAVGCWLCAVAFGIPGLVGAYHPTWVGAAATEIYEMGWIVCFAVATSFYFAINLVLPARVVPDSGYQEVDPARFEALGATHGYLEGDSEVEFGEGTVVQVQDGVEAPASVDGSDLVDAMREKV